QKNGKKAALNDMVSDRDVITVHIPNTISELLTTLNIKELLNMIRPFKLFINGKEQVIPNFSAEIWLNGNKANVNEPLPAIVELNIARKLAPTIHNLASSMGHLLQRSITVFFNHERIIISKTAVEYNRNGEILKPDDELSSGDHIEWNETSEAAFMFQDIFNYLEIQKPKNAT